MGLKVGNGEHFSNGTNSKVGTPGLQKCGGVSLGSADSEDCVEVRLPFAALCAPFVQPRTEEKEMHSLFPHRVLCDGGFWCGFFCVCVCGGLYCDGGGHVFFVWFVRGFFFLWEV